MQKILLVSQSPSFIDRNTALLDRAGFQILTATSAMEALKIHHALKVNLTIAMLDLPDMGGDVLCSLLKKESGHIPFLLVCYPSRDSLDRAARCGANAWVTKPVQPEHFLAEVAKLMKFPSRRHRRVNLRAPIHGVVGEIPFFGVAHNLSASGVLCEISIVLAPNDLITTLSIPVDSTEVVAAGKVVRTVEINPGTYHYGIEFVDLAPACRHEIINFVAITPTTGADSPCYSF